MDDLTNQIAKTIAQHLAKTHRLKLTHNGGHSYQLTTETHTLTTPNHTIDIYITIDLYVAQRSHNLIIRLYTQYQYTNQYTNPIEDPALIEIAEQIIARHLQIRENQPSQEPE